MRISDWSSDVCSSDLVEPRRRRPHILAQRDIPALPEAGAGLARSRIEREQPCVGGGRDDLLGARSEEHTSELQSLMRISYAVFCLKKKKTQHRIIEIIYHIEKHVLLKRQALHKITTQR